MPKLISLLLCIAFPGALVAQTGTGQNPAASTAYAVAATPKAAPGAASGRNGDVNSGLTSEDQKTLYAFGLSLAQSAARFRLSPSELEIVVRGLRDGVGEHPLLDVNQYTEKVYAMGDARLALIAAEQRKIGATFRAKALQEPGAIQKESGLIIIPIHPGSGPVPASNDTVAVIYQGSLTDGTVFDSTGDEPFKALLNRAATACLREGIRLMQVGAKSRLICPPELVRGMLHPLITPGSTLIYDITLVGISH